MTPQEKVLQVRGEINAALIEREDELDCCLLALLTDEGFLGVGAPGTGKSLLGHLVAASLSGARVFEVLLTMFTPPEAIFGPLKLSALKADRYERVLDGGAADCEFLILDEVFKSSPAVLNTLLMLINERKIREGLVFKDCPLRCFFGFSNEWRPEGCEATTNAFFDRFLIRKEVLPIRTPAGRKRLWAMPDLDPLSAVSTRLTAADLAACRAQVLATPFSKEAGVALEAVMGALTAEGIMPGDRRQKKAVKVCRAAAFLDAAPQVQPEHLECLKHVLWTDEREQPAKCAAVVMKVANPVGMELTSLLAEADGVIQTFNVKDAASGATCIKKLRDIHERLSKLSGGNGRARKYLDYVAAEQKRIKIAYTESV